AGWGGRPWTSPERETDDLVAGGGDQEAFGGGRGAEAGDGAEGAGEAGDAAGGVVGGQRPFAVHRPDGADGEDRGGGRHRRRTPSDGEAAGARPQGHQPVDAGHIDQSAGHGGGAEPRAAHL